MAFFQRALLQLESPFTEFRRFRGKVHIRRPRKPHFTRQLYLDLCKPIYPFTFNYKEQCANMQNKKFTPVENPFEKILARECANWFNHSKMVAFFHMNQIKAMDRKDAFVALKKENMHLRIYGKKIVNMAVKDTPFDAIQALFYCHTIIVFSEEIKPARMLKILRKTPQLVLIGGILDGKFVSKNEFVEYSTFPSLDVMRSRLCNVIQSAGLSVVNQMTQHQQILVGHLDQFVDINSEEKAKEEQEPPSQPPAVES